MCAAEWTAPAAQAMWLPEEWNVCGITVRSLSVWHFFMLDDLGNAYIRGGICNLDAATTLLLCAQMDKATGQRFMCSEDFRRTCTDRIIKKVKLLEWEDLHTGCSDFVTACSKSTRRWKTKPGDQAQDSGKSCNVPYPFHLVRILCDIYNYPIEDAWNEKYAIARVLYDAQMETQGDDSVMSPEDEQLDDAMYEVEQKVRSELVKDINATPEFIAEETGISLEDAIYHRDILIARSKGAG